jgi:DNA polymerase III epsilon subunit-like protein
MKYLMFDTETTNDIECPLCYDFGYSVIDENGTVYEKGSYVVADVFLDPSLMESAYFADKIPQYWEDIKNGKRLLRRWKTIKHIIKDVMTYHEIKHVVAHNARFDYLSTATTQRYLTCSKWRYFFPYGTLFVDTLKMARATFSKDETYITFCENNNYLNAYGKPQLTAEVIYRYLTNDITFVECHTGLEDVEIETEIFVECVRRNPTVDGLLWE